MIYLCSLYSLGAKTDSDLDLIVRQQRVDYTRKRLTELLIGGNQVISPISHTHEVSLKYKLPKEYKFWSDYDHALIDKCEEVWVLKMEDSAGSWKDSEGITDEISYAEETGKVIRYFDCDSYQ
jgi:hypothetical protein